MVNAGPAPLIFPDEPLEVLAVGAEREVSKDLAEVPGVAGWIKAGKLAPAKRAAKE